MKKRVRKQRSITSELLLWIGLIVIVPILVLSVYSYTHTISGLTQVEEEKSVLANRAAQMSIDALGETILGVTITNGYWESNRQAVLSRDIDWLNNNISDMREVVPNLDFVAETDLLGNVLVQAGDVKEFTGKLQDPFILERFKQEKTFSGIMETSKGVAVVAVSQVTGDRGESEAVGILFTGRFLTDEILAILGHTLQTDLALVTHSGQFLASSDALQEGKLHQRLSRQQPDKEQFKLERTKPNFLAMVDAPFRDMTDQIIGVIHTEVPSVSTTEAVNGLKRVGFYRIVMIAVLLFLVIYLIRQRIIVPLRHFTTSLEEVAAGRPVVAIPKRVLQAETEIVTAIQKIMEWNQVLEQTVEQRTNAIRSLLDNANQGFLSIGSDLLVKDEYSVECMRIFSRELAGVHLPELLYPTQAEDREVLTSILSEYFGETDELKKELMLSLMPEEVLIGDRTLQVEAKPFVPRSVGTGHTDGESLMFMLTDITEKRLLETRMQAEQGIMRMMVKAVTHADDYSDIARDFERFHQTEVTEAIANEETPEEQALSLYKAAHTFKGSFGFLEFDGMVAKIHVLESGLQELMARPEGFTSEDLDAYVRSQQMEQWLKDEELQLKSLLGDSFEGLGQRQSVKIGMDQWHRIERWANSVAQTEEDQHLLADLKAWRFKPIQTLLKHYPPYLKELADRKGLLLSPVRVQGGDLMVDTERYYAFAKSLVHVVRNIIIHGLEQPEERTMVGKPAHGTVTLDISRIDGMLRIEIGDDGRGIDPQVLRDKANQENMRTQADMSDQEALQLIFREQFSTVRKVSDLAGRGIGLSAVKEEVDELRGTIEVLTKLGEGTKFVFMLPDEGKEGEETNGD